jgi:hypothetical protein
MFTLDMVPGPIIETAREVARRGYLTSGRGITVIALLRDDPPNNWDLAYCPEDLLVLAVGITNPALCEVASNNTQRYDPDQEISLVVHDCRGDESDDGAREIVGSIAAIIPAASIRRPVVPVRC